MRFLHAEVSGIAKFAASEGSSVFFCDVKGARDPEARDIEALNAYLEESHTLWGLAPKHFIAISRERPPRLTLRQAVERVE